MSSKQLNYQSLQDLKPVRNLLEVTSKVINDKTLISSVRVVPGAVGAVAGAASGAAVTGGIGPTGAAVALVGGSTAATVGTVLAPVVILGAAGYLMVKAWNKRKLEQKKQAFLQQAIRNRDAILREMANTNNRNTKRIAYLEKLTNSLITTIRNLEADLRVARNT